MDNPFRAVYYYPQSIQSPTGPVIQWTLDPVFRAADPINFTLEISEVPTFSELVYSKELGNTFYAVDTTDLHKNQGDDYIYRIKLTTGDGQIFYSKNIKSEATVSERNKYLKSAEIVRKELLRMKYTGFTAFLLKRKTLGSVALSQVDEVTGTPMSDTSIDYGTGVIGGYHDPLSFIISREKVSTDRRFKQEGYGVEENDEMVARAVGFPNIENRDIIAIRETNNRYNVAGVTTTYFPGTNLQIIQNLSLRLIAPTDTVYNILLPR